MPDHPLALSGAGRFWRGPKERGSSSSNVMAPGRYQTLDSRRPSTGDDASSETFDPLLSQPPRPSFAHSTRDGSFEKLARSPSVASGSSSASGDSRYGSFSVSALSLPASSSLSVQSSGARVDRTASQANRIRDEERKKKLISHIRQMEALEEERISRDRTGSTASLEKPLEFSRSYTNIRSVARSHESQTSLTLPRTHRPSISDVAVNDRHSLGQDSGASSGARRGSGTPRSVGSEESLPAALKLPKTADQPRFGPRPRTGPMLHLETRSRELDAESGKRVAENTGALRLPSEDNPDLVEMNAIKSPAELLAGNAPWNQTTIGSELPSTKPSIRRAPPKPPQRSLLSNAGRPRSANMAELPSTNPTSPTLSVSSTHSRPHSDDSSRLAVSTAPLPKRERPVSAVPNPEAFRPSMSSQLLGLIPPTLPKRASPTPLPPANTIELSASLSVVHRPRASSNDTRLRKRVSPANMEAYNTVLHAPFPLLPREAEDEPENEEDAPDTDAAEAHKESSDVGKHHRRLDIGEHPGEPLSPKISIEPDIDPRTGERWIGSLK